jgi:hypothetical protein
MLREFAFLFGPSREGPQCCSQTLLGPQVLPALFFQLILMAVDVNRRFPLTTGLDLRGCECNRDISTVASSFQGKSPQADGIVSGLRSGLIALRQNRF